jgi:hypothetical protein
MKGCRYLFFSLVILNLLTKFIKFAPMVKEFFWNFFITKSSQNFLQGTVTFFDNNNFPTPKRIFSQKARQKRGFSLRTLKIYQHGHMGGIQIQGTATSVTEAVKIY